MLVGAACIAILAAFVASHMLFRTYYYGEFVPNTYTLKIEGIPLFHRLFDGVNFLKPFLWQTLPLTLASVLIIASRFSNKLLFLVSMFLFSLMYQIWTGGDAWPYWRMLSPILPMIFPVFIISMGYLLQSIIGRITKSDLFTGEFTDIQNVMVICTGVIVLSCIASINWQFRREVLFRDRPYQADANEFNINASIAISEITTDRASIGVFWAGTIPYYVDRYSIDFLGKSDRYIAHLSPDLTGAMAAHGMLSVPGHNKYDLRYSIAQLRPTYTQGFVWGTQDLRSWATDYYVIVMYRGFGFAVLRDSPDVIWSRVDVLPSAR